MAPTFSNLYAFVVRPNFHYVASTLYTLLKLKLDTMHKCLVAGLFSRALSRVRVLLGIYCECLVIGSIKYPNLNGNGDGRAHIAAFCLSVNDRSRNSSLFWHFFPSSSLLLFNFTQPIYANPTGDSLRIFFCV